MKTITKQNNLIWCLFVVLFAVLSCTKDAGTDFGGSGDGIQMQVSFSTEYADPNGSSTSSKGGKASAATGRKATDTPDEQSQIITLDNGLTFLATLEPQEEDAPVHARSSANGGMKASSGRGAVGDATNWRLLVYNAAGEEVDRHDGTGSNADFSFELPATGGALTEYTFVAYSAGEAALPHLEVGTPLATATVAINTQKFMHFKETKQLGTGPQPLKIVLKNQLTEIRTIFKSSIEIQAIAPITFENATYTEGDVYLKPVGEDITIEYKGSKIDAEASFSESSWNPLTEQLQSDGYTILANNDEGASYSLVIPSITLAGMSAGTPDPSSPGLKNRKIVPGARYNLVLTLVDGMDIELEEKEISFESTPGYIGTGCFINELPWPFFKGDWYKPAPGKGGPHNNPGGLHNNEAMCLGQTAGPDRNNIYVKSYEPDISVWQELSFPNSNAGIVIDIIHMQSSGTISINDVLAISLNVDGYDVGESIKIDVNGQGSITILENSGSAATILNNPVPWYTSDNNVVRLDADAPPFADGGVAVGAPIEGTVTGRNIVAAP